MTPFSPAQPLLLMLALAYLSGLATSLTPCVYPVIPIVVGYLGQQTGRWTQRLTSAVLYVLGLSCVYSLLGLIAAATGRMFGQMTTNAYVYAGFGLFVLAMGGAMMDWYAIPLPRFLQPKADAVGAKPSLWGSFLVGASSGLIASPCTAPVLAAVLLYIASERQFVRGSLLMFSFSMGMNTLLLALGFSAGLVRNLPKSGGWMVVVKKILAGLLLASGLYFIFKAGQLS